MHFHLLPLLSSLQYMHTTSILMEFTEQITDYKLQIVKKPTGTSGWIYWFFLRMNGGHSILFYIILILLYCFLHLCNAFFYLLKFFFLCLTLLCFECFIPVKHIEWPVPSCHALPNSCQRQIVLKNYKNNYRTNLLRADNCV